VSNLKEPLKVKNDLEQNYFLIIKVMALRSFPTDMIAICQWEKGHMPSFVIIIAKEDIQRYFPSHR